MNKGSRGMYSRQTLEDVMAQPNQLNGGELKQCFSHDATAGRQVDGYWGMNTVCVHISQEFLDNYKRSRRLDR